MRRELAVLRCENGQHVVHGSVVHFLAEAAARIVGEEFLEKIGTALEHGVVNRHGAGDHTVAADLRLAHAKQADHVAAVAMKAQASARKGAGAR